MAWYLIKDNKVSESIEYNGSTSYTPPRGYTLVEYNDACEAGWDFVDGVAVRPPEPPYDYTPLLEHSADQRYRKEISGINFANNYIYTDRESQAMITGIVTLMSINPNTEIKFKTDASFILANSQTMLGIATAVATHVQTCFAVESTLSEQIKANTITELSDVANAYNSIVTVY